MYSIIIKADYYLDYSHKRDYNSYKATALELRSKIHRRKMHEKNTNPDIDVSYADINDSCHLI